MDRSRRRRFRGVFDRGVSAVGAAVVASVGLDDSACALVCGSALVSSLGATGVERWLGFDGRILARVAECFGVPFVEGDRSEFDASGTLSLKVLRTVLVGLPPAHVQSQGFAVSRQFSVG